VWVSVKLCTLCMYKIHTSSDVHMEKNKLVLIFYFHTQFITYFTLIFITSSFTSSSHLLVALL
jgi:hypothetical protein